MRNWLWRTLACAGGAFAGCGALWAFMPVNADRSFTKAWLLSSPEADTSDAPIQRRSCRLRGRNQSKIAKECEAFLAGRYHELLLGNHRQALPGWCGCRKPHPANRPGTMYQKERRYLPSDLRPVIR